MVDTQDIVIRANLGYRPIIDEHDVVPNLYSREGMARQMGCMDDTPKYEDVDMKRLYSHTDGDVGDNETQGPEDPHRHSGASATQGEQSEDPTTRVLRDKEIRTISKYIC
jgi:hypothetical protein